MRRLVNADWDGARSVSGWSCTSGWRSPRESTTRRLSVGLWQYGCFPLHTPIWPPEVAHDAAAITQGLIDPLRWLLAA